MPRKTCEVKLERDQSSVWVLVEGIAAQDGLVPQRHCRAAVIDITQQKRADELAAANEALKAEMAARKQAEEFAEHARSVAEQANRAKDHFLAALSHELRTPLTPVVMGLSMLQDKLDLDPAVRQTLEMVHRNVDMEARLIDDLLDIARIARGTIVLTRRPVDLCTVIDRAIEVCKPDIEARGLEFGVDVGPARLTGSMPMRPGSSKSFGTCSRTRSSSRRTADVSVSAVNRMGTTCLLRSVTAGSALSQNRYRAFLSPLSKQIAPRPGSLAVLAWDWRSARRSWKCTMARFQSTAKAGTRVRRFAFVCRFARLPTRPRNLLRPGSAPSGPCASCWSKTTMSPRN